MCAPTAKRLDNKYLSVQSWRGQRKLFFGAPNSDPRVLEVSAWVATSSALTIEKVGGSGTWLVILSHPPYCSSRFHTREL